MAVAAVLLAGLLVEAAHQISAGDHAPDLPIVDDWLPAGLILASSAVCVWGARRRQTGPSRAAWWCFAAALLLFALAELLWGALYGDGGDVPTPNPTDVLYLGTYPLFMAGPRPDGSGPGGRHPLAPLARRVRPGAPRRHPRRPAA